MPRYRSGARRNASADHPTEAKPDRCATRRPRSTSPSAAADSSTKRFKRCSGIGRSGRRLARDARPPRASKVSTGAPTSARTSMKACALDAMMRGIGFMMVVPLEPLATTREPRRGHAAPTLVTRSKLLSVRLSRLGGRLDLVLQVLDVEARTGLHRGILD